MYWGIQRKAAHTVRDQGVACTNSVDNQISWNKVGDETCRRTIRLAALKAGVRGEEVLYQLRTTNRHSCESSGRLVLGHLFQEQPTLKHDLNWKTWGMFARDQAPEGKGIDEWMNEWIIELMNKVMNERITKWTNEQINEWTNERMSGWMDENK
jgi:hypothetical protein